MQELMVLNNSKFRYQVILAQGIKSEYSMTKNSKKKRWPLGCSTPAFRGYSSNRGCLKSTIQKSVISTTSQTLVEVVLVIVKTASYFKKVKTATYRSRWDASVLISRFWSFDQRQSNLPYRLMPRIKDTITMLLKWWTTWSFDAISHVSLFDTDASRCKPSATRVRRAGASLSVGNTPETRTTEHASLVLYKQEPRWTRPDNFIPGTADKNPYYNLDAASRVILNFGSHAVCVRAWYHNCRQLHSA